MSDMPTTPPAEALTGLQQMLVRGAFAEALGEAERLATDFPDDARVANMLGLAQMQTGQTDAALAAFTRANRADRGFASAFVNRANLLVAMGRFADALPVCEAALAAKPDPANAVKANYLLGLSRARSGALEAAVTPLRTAIDTAPDMVAAQSLLGGVLARSGRLEEAVAVLEPAFQRWPDNVETGRNLGTALTELGRFMQAATVLDAVAAQVPGEAGVQLALAQAWRGAGRSDRALAAAERAVAVAPDRAGAHGLVGSCRRDLGDTDGAIAAFDRALEITPDDPIALVARWRLSPLPPEHPDRARIDSLLADPETALDHRAALELALFHADDKAGDPERAFVHLTRSLQARRAARPYDIASPGRLFEAIHTTFSKPVPAVHPAQPSPVRPVFIVGMPRSGTSLVEQILASHGEVFGAGELPLLGRAMAEAGWGGGAVGAPPTPQMLADLRAAYLDGLARLDAAASVITDKTPMNFRWLGFALSAMPEASALVLRRDPRATCFSNLTHDLSGRANDFGADMVDTAEMYRLHLGLADLWRALFPDRVSVVDYERLTEDQEAGSRALVAAVGLDWDPACLTFHITRRRVRTASAEQVRQPMYTGSSQTWRRYEPWLGPMLTRLDGL